MNEKRFDRMPRVRWWALIGAPPRATHPNGTGPLEQQKARADLASGPARDHIQRQRNLVESGL